MGMYIESCEGLSKQEWIEKYGERVDSLLWPGHDRGYYPVVVIHNEHFDAMLLCCCKSEFDRVLRFSLNGDVRPLTFYHVKYDDIKRNLGERARRRQTNA